jgi:hypothetical protein
MTATTRRLAACLTADLIAAPVAAHRDPHAQPPSTPRFDALVSLAEAKMKAYGVPGVALGVVADGKDTIRGLGVINVPDPLAVTDHTVFRSRRSRRRSPRPRRCGWSGRGRSTFAPPCNNALECSVFLCSVALSARCLMSAAALRRVGLTAYYRTIPTGLSRVCERVGEARHEDLATWSDPAAAQWRRSPQHRGVESCSAIDRERPVARDRTGRPHNRRGLARHSARARSPGEAGARPCGLDRTAQEDLRRPPRSERQVGNPLQIVRALPLFRWSPAQAHRVEEILVENVTFPRPGRFGHASGDREFRGISDAFGLQQVPSLVLRKDLQTCSDGETKHRDEGILEAVGDA